LELIPGIYNAKSQAQRHRVTGSKGRRAAIVAGTTSVDCVKNGHASIEVFNVFLGVEDAAAERRTGLQRTVEISKKNFSYLLCWILDPG
jgi:hypothetical protein